MPRSDWRIQQCRDQFPVYDTLYCRANDEIGSAYSGICHVTDHRLRGFNPWLVGCGFLLLLYAILGNYIALPGYIRFIERGGTSAAGNTFDFDVLVGATKTILWMYSFQLGTLALACAYSIRENLYSIHLAGLGLVWLTVWSWPSLPQPGAWFYVIFGCILVIAISMALLGRDRALTTKTTRTLFLASILFFAFATWEVCGLGTTGRMLHPAQSEGGLAHTILITQSTKLMIELVLAWSLLLARVCS